MWAPRNLPQQIAWTDFSSTEIRWFSELFSQRTQSPSPVVCICPYKALLNIKLVSFHGKVPPPPWEPCVVGGVRQMITHHHRHPPPQVMRTYSIGTHVHTPCLLSEVLLSGASRGCGWKVLFSFPGFLVMNNLAWLSTASSVGFNQLNQIPGLTWRHQKKMKWRFGKILGSLSSINLCLSIGQNVTQLQRYMLIF